MESQQQSPLSKSTLDQLFKNEVVSLPISPFRPDQTCTLYRKDYESMLPRCWLRTAPINFLAKFFLDSHLREVCKLYASRGEIDEEEHLQYVKMVDMYVATMLMSYDDEVVLRSLQGLELFSSSTKYLVIPVNTENGSGSHWLLGCFKNGRFKGGKAKSQLVMFDSAGSGLALGEVLRQKLAKLYGLLKGQQLQIELRRCEDVPVQSNSYDCGVYTLAFVEYVLKQIVNELEEKREEEGIKWNRLTKEYRYLVANSTMARQKYRRQVERRLLKDNV